jgi:2-phospho-L-lactate transferase/gluconeogenesis factor (CofD/UPF0052 family)
MKIVILAGGTGSIALQSGLYNLFREVGDVDTKVIVNAYDNGLSTGAVRKVMDGRILGPSDVRKNQTTRLQLERPGSAWLSFLNIRFTVESSKAHAFCRNAVTELATALAQADERGRYPASAELTLGSAIDEFFNTSIATKIDYNDFSLANIIYAGLARANGNSLRAAARIMAGLMNIKDNVLLNDDTSLFLGARTLSGKKITDEGDIVSWGKHDDPFVDVFFTDADGNETSPVLCQEAQKALLEADLIVLSSGTQWSSLIPTYASWGFKDVMSETRAKILMVMNRQPDKDSPGQTAGDIIKILVPKYFKENTLHVVCDSSGSEKMQLTDFDFEANNLIASVNTFDLGHGKPEHQDWERVHNWAKLSLAIGKTFFRDYLSSSHFVFDYDDTLVGRGGKFLEASKRNVELILEASHARSITICTGNSIKAVNLRSKHPWGGSYPLTVYADGGLNKYMYETAALKDTDDGQTAAFIACAAPGAVIKKEGRYGIDALIEAMREVGIPLNKIENRGNVMISIKPIEEEYRKMVLNLVALVLKGSGLIARPTGRTTIDISRPGFSKLDAIKDIEKHAGSGGITYIGDELHDGNDQPVTTLPHVACLNVKTPVTTAFFLTTLCNILRDERDAENASRSMSSSQSVLVSPWIFNNVT